ncbi:hypothetical protein CC80DRAFT_535926 [Byssothecium circinans]|uniref:Uncharacterized protein n=1 Tax=Byssothecium circinans TaxID=147558 RepID=A0A6A5TTZ7_9PLEO|nr:hypothetical protein CC80DRAFT_535926 [Byssothecium circinans]
MSQSYKMDIKLFPAEIRNAIYEYALVPGKNPVTLLYNEDGTGNLHLPEGSISKKHKLTYFNKRTYSANDETKALINLSLMGRQIGREARGVFFERNKFTIRPCHGGCSSAYHCGDITNSSFPATRFLQSGGNFGNRYLRSLSLADDLLDATGDVSINFLWLRMAKQLRTLKLTITERDLITPGPFKSWLRSANRGEESSALEPFADRLIEGLRQFPELEKVIIGYPEDYRSMDPVHGMMYEVLDKIREKVSEGVGRKVAVYVIRGIPGWVTNTG